MPPITIALAFFLACALALALVDLLRRRSLRRLVLNVGCLVIAVVVLNLTTGFPFQPRRAFGNAFPVPIAIGLMFVGIILGMAANYLFFAKRGQRFHWMTFARPFAVSPIVLLPLIGSLQGAALEPVQLICFVILAFQNGFFWQQVLKDASPTTK